MLKLTDIHSGYGELNILHGVELAVRSGEILALLGRNGAGKSTIVKTIQGLVQAKSGRVELNGVDITKLATHRRAAAGMACVPQGRRLFSEMTVAENLAIGLDAGIGGPDALERALVLFPKLRERLYQRAGTLSGGERQMVAMARAICVVPKLLLLDEPSEGLMPSMVAAVLASLRTMRGQGMAILLIEQKVEAALEVADRIGFVEHGRIAASATPAEIAAHRELLQRYVGVGLNSEPVAS